MKNLGEIKDGKDIVTKEYVDQQDNSIIDDLMAVADAVDMISCCSTGEFVNSSTSASVCNTGFGKKPKIFKLYYIADSKASLAAELRPELDTNIQKLFYNNLPIKSIEATSDGKIEIQWYTGTGMTFIWEAYK